MNNIMQFTPVYGFSYTEPSFPDQKAIDIPKITYMDFEQIVNSEHETEWYIKDFIEKGGHTLITGKTGHGKTMLMLHIALTLASDDCSDLFGFHKTKTVTVAIIQCENPISSMKDRIKKLCKINPAFEKGQKNVKLVQFDGQHDNPDILLSNDNFVGILNKINDDINPDILIIDPYLCYSGVNENDNNKNRLILKKLHSKLNESGITSIIVHHEGKGFKPSKEEKVSPDQIRGASSIGDSMFWHWTIYRKTETTLLLSCAKARDSERNRQINLSITDGIYFSLPNNPYDPVKLVEILKANNGSFETQMEFINVIKSHMKDLGINISTVKAKEIINNLVDKGLIMKKPYDKNKIKYFLLSNDNNAV